MQATFKLFLSCLFCFSLALVSGCGNTDGTFTGSGKSTASEKLPTLTPAEQTEVDGFMTFGRNAALTCMQRLRDDRSMNETLALKYLKHLVSQGADVNAQGTYRYGASEYDLVTPLSVAVDRQDIELVKFLVSKGADVNAKTTAIAQATMLMRAVSRENIEIIKCLVSNGADVNAKCTWGDSPLDYAENTKNTAAAEYLKSVGAKLGSEL